MSTQGMIGRKFGCLTVQKFSHFKNSRKYYFCKCDCGNEKTIRAGHLLDGNTKTCGDKKKHNGSLIGKKFHFLTVIDYAGKNQRKIYTWLCQCECGKKKVISGADLKCGGTKSCGCVRDIRAKELHKSSTPPQPDDLHGKRFGYLTVLKLSSARSCGSAIWICQCECGNIHSASSANLKKGNVKSCGCYLKSVRANMGKMGANTQRIIKSLSDKNINREQLQESIGLMKGT